MVRVFTRYIVSMSSTTEVNMQNRMKILSNTKG